MGRNAVDPVRRLTLALLLASVAALRVSVDDAPADDAPADHAPADDARIVTAPSPSPSEVPWRIGTAMVYDERRCSERALTRAVASLLELAQGP